MLVKRDILTIFRNIKKVNQSFLLGFFYDEESIVDEFILLSTDGSYMAYSKRPKEHITSSCLIGPDDVEYIEEAIKNADAKDEIYLSLDGEELSVQSLETLFYRCKVRLIEHEIPIEEIDKRITKKSKDTRESIKLINTLADKKGYEEVPYVYVRLDGDILFYSFTPWVSSLYKLDKNVFSFKRTIRFDPDKISELLGYLPGGVNAEIDMAVTKDFKIICMFNNCEVFIQGEKANKHDFLDTLFNLDYTTKLVLDREKLKTMLGKIKGVYGDASGSFISFIQEDDEFFKIEVNEYSYKVPFSEYSGNDEINIYGRYIKEAASKVTSGGIILLVNQDIIRVVSEDEDIIVTSMTKRTGNDLIDEE